MLHYYKWNRANKKSFAERPGVERWAGPSLFWFVLSEWCVGGSLLRRAWWGGSPASSAANGLTPSFQPFLLLLFCCDEQVCGCFGCLPWPAWGRTMKNGKNSKAQAWGPLAFLPCPCLSMSLFSWAFGEPIMPGDSERSLSHLPQACQVRRPNGLWTHFGRDRKRGLPSCPCFPERTIFPPFLHIWQTGPPSSPPQWEARRVVAKEAAGSPPGGWVQGAPKAPGLQGRTGGEAHPSGLWGAQASGWGHWFLCCSAQMGTSRVHSPPSPG